MPPKVLIASRVLGASGQPWLWRQIQGLERFERALLCWDRRVPGALDPFQNFRVHVLATHPAPYDGPQRWAQRLSNLLGGNFYASIGREKRELEGVLHRERADVVLCYFGDIAMRLLPSARKHRIPVVAYLHGDFLFNSNHWYRHSLRRCMHAFAAMVVVTQAERDWLLAEGLPADKIHVIPCGAPTHVFRPRNQASEPTVTFAMCSRLAAEKGCDISLRAFAKLAATESNLRLMVFGDGPSRGELEQLAAQLGLAGQVAFQGYVGEDVIASKLQACDVFIQHSLTKEGSPVSIAEAMACAVPVVTTPVGGMVDQVVDSETGFLVPQRDVDAMASAMRVLCLDRALRQRMGQAGRLRAMSFFDSGRQTERLSRVIAEVHEAHTRAKTLLPAVKATA